MADLLCVRCVRSHEPVTTVSGTSFRLHDNFGSGPQSIDVTGLLYSGGTVEEGGGPLALTRRGSS